MIPQLAMMQVMPAWSVANGYAVIGSNTGVHDAVVKQMAATGAGRKSIRDTPGYKEVAAKLPTNLVTLDYADSRTQYTQMMTVLAAVLADGVDVRGPGRCQAAAHAAVARGDHQGYEAVAAGPAGWTRMGSTRSTRAPAWRSACRAWRGPAWGWGVATAGAGEGARSGPQCRPMSNLKQIGLGLHMYGNDHQDNLPADLEQAKSYWGNARVLESPRKPKDFAGPSYLYVPGRASR